MPLISTLAGGSARGLGGMRTFAPANLTTDILVVAGGGSGTAGGYAGAGGGAGGYLEFASEVLTFNTNYTVTVGAGGSYSGSVGADGTFSKFASLTTVVGGGGGGGGTAGAANNGRNGGSGGGGATNDTSGGGVTYGGSPTTGQGFAGGGNGNFTSPPYPCGGGGGAGGVGQTGPNSTTAGNGGVGKFTTLSNAMGAATSTGQLSGGNYYYAGGGAGSTHLSSGTNGSPGLGGGGAGGTQNGAAGSPGTANTGGGGGSGTQNTAGASGGSGIVITRYSGSQQAYGGTVFTTGGFTYHRFLSSSIFYSGLTLPVTGASLWLDASDSANVTRSGSNVTAWLDKSGNGHNFTAPSTKEPLYVTNLQNGLPGIKFYPSSAIKYLTNTSLGNWSESIFTAFFVFNSTNTAGNYPALLGRNSTGAVALGGNNGGPSGLSISKIGNATQTSSLTYTGTTADVGVYKATAASTTSVTVQAYKNGTAASATITQGSITSTGDKNSIGASVDGVGDSMAPDAYLCEVILYTSALSDTDRNKVEGYLKAKWGTP